MISNADGFYTEDFYGDYVFSGGTQTRYFFTNQAGSCIMVSNASATNIYIGRSNLLDGVSWVYRLDGDVWKTTSNTVAYVDFLTNTNPIIGRFIKENHIREAEGFFEKHGAMAIIIGRYMPIVRTFVPFVAGISQFPFVHFLRNTVIAAFSWSFIATGAGYMFGNIPFVKRHFSVIIIGIALVTLLPTIIGVIRSLVINHRTKKIDQSKK